MKSKTLILLITLIPQILIVPWSVFGLNIDTGYYLVYDKEVVVEKYPGLSYQPDIHNIINGKCFERSKYVVSRTGAKGFTLERMVLSFKNESYSAVTCLYLNIVDQGQVKDWYTNRDNYKVHVLMFDWSYDYNGPVFTDKIIYNYSIPWVQNIYLYLSVKYPLNSLNTSTVTYPSKKYGSLDVSFNNILLFKYSEKTRFLERLEYTIVVNIYGKPYMKIVLNIKLIESSSVNNNIEQGKLLYILSTIILCTAFALYYRLKKHYNR